MTRSLVFPLQVIRLKPKFPSPKNIFYRWAQYDLLKLLNLLNLLSVLCNYIHALVWSFTWLSLSILSNSSRIISLWEKIGAHLSDLCPMTILYVQSLLELGSMIQKSLYWKFPVYTILVCGGRVWPFWHCRPNHDTLRS